MRARRARAERRWGGLSGLVVSLTLAACASDEAGVSRPDADGADASSGAGSFSSGGFSSAGGAGGLGTGDTSHAGGAGGGSGAQTADGSTSADGEAAAESGGAHASGGAMTATGGRRPDDGGTTDPGVIAMGVRWVGRVDVSSPGRVRFSWSGAGFVADFSGTGLGVILDGSTRLVFQAVVDGARSPVFTATPGAKTYALASNLAKGPHTVELYRQTEGQNGDSEISLFTVYDGALSHAPASPGRSLEVVGDSLSCGYGDLGKDETCSYSIETQSHWDSYGAVAARLVGADVATIAVSGRGVYMNYDGTTTMPVPAYYDRTLASSATPEWAFPMEPDAVIVNLGTNDFAKGRDPGAAFGNAYEQFIARLRTLHPNAYILCAVGPMLSDPGLSKVKAALGVVVDARRKTGDSKIEMLEFPPQTQSDFGCDFHPKVDKHRRMGEQLAAVLESKLGW